jgi:hypothetical protein
MLAFPAAVYDKVEKETINDKTECFPEENLQNIVEVDVAQNIFVSFFRHPDTTKLGYNDLIV